MIAFRQTPPCALFALMLTAAGQPCLARDGSPGAALEGDDASKVPREMIQLQPVWRITEADLDEAGMLMGLIGDVDQDAEGRILLLDVQLNCVWIYNMDGSLEMSIGREGQGPGELSGPVQVGQLPDGRYAVLESFPGRLVTFDSSGSPGGTIVPMTTNASTDTPTSLSRFQVAGDTLLAATLTRSFSDGRVVSRNELGVFDMEGTQLRVLAELVQERRTDEGIKIVEEDLTWLADRWVSAQSGDVYAVFGYRGYEITVFERASAGQRTVSRPYDSVQRDAQEIQDAETGLSRFTRGDPSAEVRVSDVYPDIVSLTMRSNSA